jgi:hypothetical protein
MPAARTASSCSTRSWPPRIAWSSRTPVATSARTPSAHPPSRSASSSTWWIAPCARTSRRTMGPRSPPASASSCAIRCSHSTRATTRSARSCLDGPGASTGLPLPAPALWSVRAPPGARSSPARFRRSRGRSSRSISWCVSCSTRSGRFCGGGSTSCSATGARRWTTASRSSWERSSDGRWDSACSMHASRAPIWTPASRPRSPVGSFRPAHWPGRCSRR